MRTHLAVAVLAILLFVPNVVYKTTFVFVCLIATAMPDIDSPTSLLGKRFFSKPFQLLFHHRGFLHSFTFLLLITLPLALFLPWVALPFFLGYGLHLLIDSFTIEGFRPFYPWKKTISGKIRTGGKFDSGFFVAFVLVDFVILFIQLKGFF